MLQRIYIMPVHVCVDLYIYALTLISFSTFILLHRNYGKFSIFFPLLNVSFGYFKLYLTLFLLEKTMICIQLHVCGWARKQEQGYHSLLSHPLIS
jgi:hypothetical protein